MTVDDFVELRGPLRAGHATQPRCLGGQRMLLLDDDDQLPVSPTDAEALLANSLGSDGLAAIDEAIVKVASRSWLKVARIVLDAIRAAGFPTEEALVQLHARRTMALVSAGRLEAHGNLHRPRFSEVRRAAGRQ